MEKVTFSAGVVLAVYATTLMRRMNWRGSIFLPQT
jgi:hypothetical protein